jgi:hypothetical protein
MTSLGYVDHQYKVIHSRYYYDRAFVSDDFNYRRGRHDRESHVLDMHVRRGEREMERNHVRKVEGEAASGKADHSMDGRLSRISQKQEEEARKLEELLAHRRARRAQNDVYESV